VIVVVTVEATPEYSKRDYFSEMARQHHRDLLVFARALVRNEQAAHDIVQESFVAAWKGFERFDKDRDFGAWMRGFARNKWREYLRKNNREIQIEDDVLEMMERQIQGWQDERQDGGPSIFIKLDQCLKKLPGNMAEAVTLSYTDGLSSDEASAKLGISSASLRKRLERARLKLKDCLETKH